MTRLTSLIIGASLYAGMSVAIGTGWRAFFASVLIGVAIAAARVESDWRRSDR
jgi:hypothetical protein